MITQFLVDVVQQHLSQHLIVAVVSLRPAPEVLS